MSSKITDMLDIVKTLESKLLEIKREEDILSLFENIAESMRRDAAKHKETAKAVKKVIEEPKTEEDDEPKLKPSDKLNRKPRATKPKAEPEPDLDKLREEISVMAKHIGSGDSDDCADELDDLMDEYDVRSVKKLGDLQVQEFHKELKTIVAKYYDIEE
jgi:hypothetical protein